MGRSSFDRSRLCEGVLLDVHVKDFDGTDQLDLVVSCRLLCLSSYILRHMSLMEDVGFPSNTSAVYRGTTQSSLDSCISLIEITQHLKLFFWKVIILCRGTPYRRYACFKVTSKHKISTNCTAPSCSCQADKIQPFVILYPCLAEADQSTDDPLGFKSLNLCLWRKKEIEKAKKQTIFGSLEELP